IAAVVGFLLSPLTPTGIARIAEPNPGFAFDGAVVGLGALAVLVIVIGAGAFPAWRAAVANWSPLGTAEVRRSRRRLLGSGLPAALSPSGRTGIRMATDPGRGRTAVPVRTAILGVALSIVALAASVSFGSSLTHLE